MEQQSSYGTCNSALSCTVKQEQHTTTQPQTRIQNVDMLTYNTSNSNIENISGVVAETGGNTFSSAGNNVLEQSTSITNLNTNAGVATKEKSAKQLKQQLPKKPPPTIETFWPNILQEVQTVVIDSKHQSLPLARIKKIMKLDENAKMIAAEAPTLFAKACEFFIQELTMRAWIHTDESKRRTLQRSDIAQAIANYDQFDFLIDIVPREDIKPPNHRRHHNESVSNQQQNTSQVTNTPAANNSAMTTTVSNVVTGEILNVTGLPAENISSVATAQTTTAGSINQSQPAQVLTAATSTNPTPHLQIIQQTSHPQQQLQYFITIPGQQSGQAQLVQQLQLQQQQQQQQQHINNGLATTTPLTAASLNLVSQQPQQIILTAANTTSPQTASLVQHQHQTALLQNIAQHQQNAQHPQQLQLLQQVMLTPNGEITNMPIAINSNQLNLLRLQMQQQHQQPHQQQIIFPTQLLTTQQLLQLQAHSQNHNQVNSGATTHIVHHPHQQQQQQQPQTTTTANNIYINANSAVSNQSTSAAASIVSTDRNMGSTFRNNC